LDVAGALDVLPMLPLNGDHRDVQRQATGATNGAAVFAPPLAPSRSPEVSCTLGDLIAWHHARAAAGLGAYSG